MTPEQADSRIIKSRLTLNAYLHGGTASPENLPLIMQEIVMLTSIAEAHPVKAEKLMRLVQDWRQYLGRIEKKLH